MDDCTTKIPFHNFSVIISINVLPIWLHNETNDFFKNSNNNNETLGFPLKTRLIYCTVDMSLFVKVLVNVHRIN